MYIIQKWDSNWNWWEAVEHGSLKNYQVAMEQLNRMKQIHPEHGYRLMFDTNDEMVMVHCL